MLDLSNWWEWKKVVFGMLLLGWGSIISSQSDYKLAEQDSLALVAFYWATDGPNWISNQDGFGIDDLSTEWQDKYDGQFNNWFDGPAKDWFGVRVEKRAIPNTTDSTYRVTWVWPVIGRRTDGQNRLDGYVPKEIGLMTALEQFRVNGNDGFRWELLPDELYQASLEHLDVEAAWFGGGLSDALRNCKGIRKLNTRYNYFDYMPNLDFLDEAGLRNLDGTQWFYNARLSYFYLERIIDYFYSISPVLQEFGFEARDMFDVGDEMEIVAPIGTAVEMICNDAGSREEDITYQWFKDGLSRFGRKNKTYAISSVKESDYGHYTTRITNEYVKAYDRNGNYGEVFTKGIHLVAEPVPPVIERGITSNNGQYIDLYFSKPMTASTGFGNLQIQSGDRILGVLEGIVRGRIDREVRIFLDEPVLKDETVSLSFPGGEIRDANGGLMTTVEQLPIENRVRIATEIAVAKTTLDGSGVLLEFDQYMDMASLATGQFVVNGDDSYEIASTTLSPGPVDAHISKQVLLTLTTSIVDSAEVITVQYVGGQVAGLYAGSLSPSDVLPVENRVRTERTDVRIRFEDGSESLDNLMLQASWKAEPIPLYDDGTNGDEQAEDHIWTYQASLVDDDYVWDVLVREEIEKIDTLVSVDPETGNTVLTLVPTTVNQDSLLSGNYPLSFSVLDEMVAGDTIYGILNRDVIFNLKVYSGPTDIYLMGIENDWTTGALMPAIGDNTYRYTLPKLTAGDIIEYNYRRGEDWENQTPETRSYTVKNGENIINDEFGIFTHTTEIETPLWKIYPNPSTQGIFQVEQFDDLARMAIYRANGQLLRRIQASSSHTFSIDLSNQPKGIYFFVGTTLSGQQHAHMLLFQ